MQGKTVIAIAHRLSTIAAWTAWWCWTRATSPKLARMPSCSPMAASMRLWQHQTGGFVGID